MAYRYRKRGHRRPSGEVRAGEQLRPPNSHHGKSILRMNYNKLLFLYFSIHFPLNSHHGKSFLRKELRTVVILKQSLYFSFL